MTTVNVSASGMWMLSRKTPAAVSANQIAEMHGAPKRSEARPATSIPTMPPRLNRTTKVSVEPSS